MARICIKNSLFFGQDTFSSLLVPWCTYCDPEVAHVGLYRRDLEGRGVPYEIYRKDFADNDRAICEGDTRGFVQVVLKLVCPPLHLVTPIIPLTHSLSHSRQIYSRKGTGVILGATVVGKGAGDLISEITLAMQTGVDLGTLVNRPSHLICPRV
jgi:pyruvate/2-oxoglutarate dehydrogenase complex dihydrolipoamide dehydrogenase (E3) component